MGGRRACAQEQGWHHVGGTSTELSSEGESTFLQGRTFSGRGRDGLLMEAAQGDQRLDQEPKGS